MIRKRSVLLASAFMAAVMLSGALPFRSLEAQTDPGRIESDDSSRAVSRPLDMLRGTPASIRALGAQARSEQETFERNHRNGLRFYNGGADATCEVEMGRICYWNNNGDVPPPAERNDAKLERQQLLDLLKRAQAENPEDDWVSGMRVRYAVEGKEPEVALEAAQACGGTAWWCDALKGLALHNMNRHVESTAAFTAAMATMPEGQRCEWTNLSYWLEPAMQQGYKALDCSARISENTRIFRLAQPLWMLRGNDIANEWYSRLTISRVHSLGRLPYDLQWGDDLLQSQLRFGWPTAWSVQNGGVADPRPPQVVGHEPTPSYDFMPSRGVLEQPVGATANEWDLNRKKAQMRYAPRYASGFGMLPSQFARFRRGGDTTLLAGGYRLMRELEMGRAPYTAALTLDGFDGGVPAQVVRDSAAANAALLLPITRPMLASLEVLAPSGKRAARIRETVEPLPAGARLSDYMLLQRGDESATPTLEKNAEQAFGSDEIVAGTTIGLYWEIYRQATPAAPLQVSLRATRLKAGFFQRIGSALKLSKALTPVSIRYNDNGRPDGGTGRSLSLSFPSVPSGDYQLTLMVSGAGVSDSTSRVIRVMEGR